MTLNQAIETAKSKTNDPKWLRAIEKAAKLMASGELVVTLLHGYALVTSPRDSYRVNGACPCAARTAHCYHRAAKRLTEMMESAPVEKSRNEFLVLSTARADIIAAIKSTWSRKFPHDNLSDNLMARFKKNQLEMLADDMLAGVYAAIA